MGALYTSSISNNRLLLVFWCGTAAVGVVAGVAYETAPSTIGNIRRHES